MPGNAPYTTDRTVQQNMQALHKALIARDLSAHKTLHDLRTPLNTLIGLMHLMRLKFGAHLPDTALEYLTCMTGAVEQLDTRTDALLDQMRSQPRPLNMTSIDARDCLDCVLHDLSEQMQKARATVRIAGKNRAVVADPTLLRILLEHLLQNALQNPHASRALHIDVIMGSGVLTISDTGAGFDPDAAHAIFLPWRGAPPAGIGLATCRAICDSFGWTITASSDGKTGARFDVHLCDRADGMAEPVQARIESAQYAPESPN